MDIIEEIDYFYNNFKYEKGIIGFSEKNKPIKYFAVEKSQSPVIIMTASIHAREYINSYFLLEEIKDFIKNGKVGKAYFIPCLNPDGVKISEKTIPLYKANARGVDLNTNFDANWGSGKENTKIKGKANFVGKFPFSESETKSIRDFTLFVCPDITISLHTKGEEIYYEFFQKGVALLRDFYIAEKISSHTNYKIKSVLDSAGGYKDWCIQNLSIPALTIECGNDNLPHPIKKDNLDDIINHCLGITRVALEELDKWKKKT